MAFASWNSAAWGPGPAILRFDLLCLFTPCLLDKAAGSKILNPHRPQRLGFVVFPN